MPAPNKSIREKSAARMAAVQIAYNYRILQKTPRFEAMLKDFDKFRDASEEQDLPAAIKDKPHMPTFKKLLEGYADHFEVLKPIAEESLHGDWKPERVNPLLLIILEYAVFELDHNRELSEAIIVNEYTDVGARLLDVRDVDFLHASLKQLSQKLRA